MTSKGQVTVPREIRDRLGLESGDKMAFTMLSDGTVVMRPKTRRLAARRTARSTRVVPLDQSARATNRSQPSHGRDRGPEPSPLEGSGNKRAPVE
ncbi:MAG TPA: AbrB/MazE/SpoVT family DNA-binding domain-containing protein [Quisquiliibacterium sp.]|nr:AbrB/MazE/SpoVT family DNA-binding domain-containing protein [Quisquiliibacterium sp.]